jgi:hypothetical protein
MFGSIVCKLHAVLENFGKILSALIITAMSFDRFAGVCHPQKKYLRSSSVAICILVGMIYKIFIAKKELFQGLVHLEKSRLICIYSESS